MLQYSEAICILILIGSSSYGLYQLNPNDNSYGYTAAAFCAVHGFLALVRVFDSEEECGRSFNVSANITDVIPLPVANIELYMASTQSEVALVHMLSLILLVYEMVGSLSDDWDQSNETVKDLSVVSNIGSAVFLGMREENYFHVGIGAAAGVARFGSAILNSFEIKVEPQLSLLGKATIVGLMTYTLTNNK